MKTICVYHAECADGFAAAWVLNQALPNVIFIPGVYSSPPPDVTGATVYIVDFSYSAGILRKMLETADSITLIDHHLTAKTGLRDFSHPRAVIKIDTQRSGAMLTWQHFFGDQPPPELLNHLEDHDLWMKLLPGTDEVMASIDSYAFDPRNWSTVWDPMFTPEGLARLKTEGVVLLRNKRKLIANYLKAVPLKLSIGGHKVQVLNVPRILAPEVASQLAAGRPFAATYYDTATHHIFSLRSDNLGLDVNLVAELYGGGGHKHAAGFSVPHHITDPVRSK